MRSPASTFVRIPSSLDSSSRRCCCCCCCRGGSTLTSAFSFAFVGGSLLPVPRSPVAGVLPAGDRRPALGDTAGGDPPSAAAAPSLFLAKAAAAALLAAVERGGDMLILGTFPAVDLVAGLVGDTELLPLRTRAGDLLAPGDLLSRAGLVLTPTPLGRAKDC
jgi:hypothetical protein